MVDGTRASPRKAKNVREGARNAPAARQRPGLHRLPDLLRGVLTVQARQRGLADAALIDDWALIVGSSLAGRCQPVKIVRDRGVPVLHLRTTGSGALELQHAAPQIVERINAHFGFGAVGRLRLIQAPAVRTPPRRPARLPPLSVEAARAVESAVGGVADPSLRAALAGLGRAIHRQPADDTPPE